MLLFHFKPVYQSFTTQMGLKFAPPTDDGAGVVEGGEEIEETGDDEESSDGDSDADSDARTSEKKSSKRSEYVPYKRFEKVNKDLQAFRELGLTPTQVRQMAREYTELIDAINAEQLKEQGSSAHEKKGRIPEAKRQQLAEDLEEVFPGISKIGKMLEKLGELDHKTELVNKSTLSQTLDRASDRITDLLDGKDFDTDDKKFVKQVEVMVATAIRGNKKLDARLRSGDLEVVEEVFEEIYDEFLSDYVVKPRKQKSRIPNLLRQSQGLGGKISKSGGDEDLSPREKQAAKKRKDDKEFFELYHELAAANRGE